MTECMAADRTLDGRLYSEIGAASNEEIVRRAIGLAGHDAHDDPGDHVEQPEIHHDAFDAGHSYTSHSGKKIPGTYYWHCSPHLARRIADVASHYTYRPRCTYPRLRTTTDASCKHG